MGPKHHRHLSGGHEPTQRTDHVRSRLFERQFHRMVRRMRPHDGCGQRRRLDLDQNADPGTYEYKFTIDGWNAQEWFSEGEACTSTIDGFTNRTVTVAGVPLELAPECFSECGPCQGAVTGYVHDCRELRPDGHHRRQFLHLRRQRLDGMSLRFERRRHRVHRRLAGVLDQLWPSVLTLPFMFS